MPNARRAAQFLTVALIVAFGVTISITTNAQSATTLGPGQYTSLAIRADGTPVISAYDPVEQDLLLYSCADPVCEFYSTLTLDSLPQTDPNKPTTYSSLKLGTDGFPIVAYYKASENKVYLVYCANLECSSVSKHVMYSPATSDIGQFIRLAVSSSNLPTAAYYDISQSRLVVLRCTAPKCVLSTNTRRIADTPNVGEHLSMALNSSGNPMIAYQAASTPRSLKLAVCAEPQCTSLVGTNAATIDNDDNVGQYTSIQMGADGHPIIAYYHLTFGDLQLMACDDALCASKTITVLDSVGDVGRYTSMVLRNGLPVIAYQDVTNGDLKLAECGDTACVSRTIRTIDDSGTFEAPTGLYTSLAIRPDGTPVIAYSDSAGILRVADLGNREPSIALPAPYSSGSVAVESGQPVSFTVIGTDPDNLPAQSLTYSMSGQVPDGASLDPDTGEFSWTPDNALQTYNLSFTVHDDGTPSKSASVGLSMSVVTTRQPPTLIVPPVQRVAELAELTFTISATDPDPGDTVTLASGPLPTGATFDSVSGEFRWRPTSDQLGLHTVTFTATDGFTAPVSADVLISVDDQVVLNAGFEQGALLPDLWKLRLPTSDRYDCVNPAHEGLCAFRLKGKPNKLTTLTQPIDPALLNKGDTVEFYLWANATKAIPGKIGHVKITYKDRTVKKAVIKLGVSMTGGWVLISAPPALLTKKIRAVNIKLMYRGDRGRVVIDAVSVVIQRPIGPSPRQADGLLPVPLPSGFRR
jgi:hypothetical protein